MRIYYAHCMDIYHTKEESNDITILHRAGFDVVNPSDPALNEGWESKGMAYADELIRDCDALVFKRIPDGRISGGVAYEIMIANSFGMPVLEFDPDCSNTMTKEQTKEYLRASRNREWYLKREAEKH